MSLVLKIDQDENFGFFQKYDLLTVLQKEIWKKVTWWVRKYPNAFPTQKRIAESCRCSRKHVNETYRTFEKYGWLSLTSRGKNRSKILGVPTSLSQMDLSKREYYKKVEVTSEVTYSTNRCRRTTSRGAGGLSDDLFEPILIPPHIKKLKDLPLEAKLKLSLVPEYIYQEALYSAKLQAKKGTKFTNEIGYVVGTAIRMAENQGYKIPWMKYYKTRKCYGNF